MEQTHVLYCSIQHHITQTQAVSVEEGASLIRVWFPYIIQSCRLLQQRITIFGNFSNLPNPHPNFELPHHTPTENHPNWGRNFEKVDPDWASKLGKKFDRFHAIIQGSSYIVSTESGGCIGCSGSLGMLSGWLHQQSQSVGFLQFRWTTSTNLEQWPPVLMVKDLIGEVDWLLGFVTTCASRSGSGHSGTPLGTTGSVACMSVGVGWR